MTIKRLLQIVTATTAGGVFTVFVLVLLMGQLIKSGTDELVNREAKLLLAVNNAYAQGLQSGQAVRNVILNPADEQALINGQRADEAFDEAIRAAIDAARGDRQERLKGAATAWVQMRAIRQEVLQRAQAGEQKAAHQLLIQEDTPAWRRVRGVLLEEIGQLEALFESERKSFSAQIDTGVIAISLVMFFCLVVITMAVWFVYKKITRPLDEAVDFAHTMAAGDLSPSDLSVRSEDEIGKVTVALNQMKAALKEMFDSVESKSHQLEEMNQSLEGMVAERTAELEEKNRKLQESIETVQNAQNQLIESEKMASLGSLVAGVAHEINTPVGIGVTAASHLQESAQAFGERFRSGGIKKSDLESFVQLSDEASRTILSNLQRAADLIQSFKKVAVNQSSENEETIEVRRYVQEILTSLTPQLKKTRLQIELECPESLYLTTMPGAFSQVVTNLVMNAILHAYEPRQEGTLKLVFQPDGNQLRFSFIDDGKGIPADVLPKIFEPFFTTKRGQGGSGLGLNIIYNIVHQSLGGTIRCESTVGEGTRFEITASGLKAN
jgi:C4-dicarboxylate-specific signal transduction histidine kinase